MSDHKTLSDRRIEFHNILKSLSENLNVYYQPPESLKMVYPAIRYSRKRVDNDFADNNVYQQQYAYEVIVIDKNPDSEIFDKVSKLPTCKVDRFYAADNLNHFVCTIYY